MELIHSKVETGRDFLDSVPQDLRTVLALSLCDSESGLISVADAVGGLT